MNIRHEIYIEFVGDGTDYSMQPQTIINIAERIAESRDLLNLAPNTKADLKVLTSLARSVAIKALHTIPNPE